MTSNSINIEKYDFNDFEIEHKPYTMILTNVIQNATNHEATFMWIYLQSMPPTWKPNKQHLMKHFNISERTYERRMSWLKSVNLIEYRNERDSNGTFSKWKLIILNGMRFNDDADLNHSAKNDGMDFNHSAKYPGSGEPTAVVCDGHINTIDIKKTKEKEIKGIYARKDDKNLSTSLKPMKYEETYFNKPEESPQFKEFWETYPIKKQKNKTRVAWDSQSCDDNFLEIIYRLREQISKDADFIAGYAPNPFTYITQERWTDELKIQPSKSLSKPKVDMNSREWGKTFNTHLF